MYAILEMRGTKPESAPIEILKDTILEALCKVPGELQSEHRGRPKRH